VATAYNADTYGDVQIAAPWGVSQTFCRPFSFNIANTTSSVGFALNDTLSLCPIPYRSAGYGVLVLGYNIEIPSLDTGTSVRMSLGDTNAASNAFQATYVATAGIGINAAGVLNPLMSFSGTTAVAPVRGVVPKQYLASAVYTTQGSTYPVINFQLKITTAPNTATTTGIIKGYLMMQTLLQSAVTF
jgi:hypothetical protein